MICIYIDIYNCYAYINIMHKDYIYIICIHIYVYIYIYIYIYICIKYVYVCVHKCIYIKYTLKTSCKTTLLEVGNIYPSTIISRDEIYPVP